MLSSKCDWLTEELRDELESLLQTDPRTARIKLARLAAAQAKPDDKEWQAAFALYIETDRCLREAQARCELRSDSPEGEGDDG